MLYYLDHAEHLVCDAYPSNIALSLYFTAFTTGRERLSNQRFQIVLQCNSRRRYSSVPFSPLSVVLSSTLKSSLSVAICRQESR